MAQGMARKIEEIGCLGKTAIASGEGAFDLCPLKGRRGVVIIKIEIRRNMIRHMDLLASLDNPHNAVWNVFDMHLIVIFQNKYPFE